MMPRALGRSRSLGRPGGLPQFPPPIATRSGYKVYRPGGATGGNTLTHSVLATAEGPFTGGVLIVLNTTNTPKTVTSAIVAPSSVFNDDINPLDSVGAAQGWTTVAGGPWTVPAATVTGSNGVPGILEIPFTVSSIARTDNATRPPILMARIYAATTGGLTSGTPSGAEIDAFNTALSPARRWASFWRSGDAVSAPATFTAPTKGLPAIAAVEFQHAVNVKTIAAGGDSIVQGVAGTAVYLSWAQRAAAALSTLSAPVSAVNCGFQGQTVEQALASLDAYVSVMRPHIVCVPCYSVNNTQTAPALAAALNAGLAFANKCQRSGMQPVLFTGLPSNLSAGTDALRLATNTSIRNAGFPFIDFDAALSDGATPARISVANNSGDNVHPNETGQALMGTTAQAVLATLL
jgi:lysophospholipase L1-like esterase